MNEDDQYETSAPSLGHLMQDLATKFSDETAVIVGDRSATYDEIWNQALRVAAYLDGEGIGPGNRVALLAENSVEWIEIAVGVSIVGARLVALSTWVEAWDLQRLLSSAQPEVLFVSTTVRDGDVVDILRGVVPSIDAAVPNSSEIPALQRVVEVGPPAITGAASYASLQSMNPFADPPRASAREIGLVLFSSGSTSTPKGVALINEDIIVNATAIGDRLGLAPSDRLFVPMPFFWAMGGPNGMMAALTHRATLVSLAKFEPATAIALFDRHRCTALYTMPNMTQAVLDHPDFAPERVSTLQKGITVGSPSEIRVVIDKLGVQQICNVYGSSELYANATATPHTAPVQDRLETNGPPLPGVIVKIVDPVTRETLREGEVGEICAAGRVAAGYMQPDGSIKPITDEFGFFGTGDLGFVNERGWLTYVGRATDMVKTRGINVAPVEVEDFLCTHPDVVSALVYGIEDTAVGQVLVSVIVAAPGAEVGEEALRQWCKGKVASYKIPAHVVVVDELPTTQTGKISRTVAKARFHGTSSAQS